MFHVMLGNQVIHAAAKDDRSEERFSRNAETDIVCRLLLEKKKNHAPRTTAPRATPSPLPPPAPSALQSCPPPTAPRSYPTTPCLLSRPALFFFFFFNDTATTEIYTLSLHDALPI